MPWHGHGCSGVDDGMGAFRKSRKPWLRLRPRDGAGTEPETTNPAAAGFVTNAAIVAISLR